MEKTPPRRLRLGDPLNCTVVKPLGGRRFLVRTSGAPDGWTVELHTRRPEGIEEGQQGTYWVAKVAPLQGEVLVHEGDFGRLPISDAMRPRYRAALRAILGEAEPDPAVLADGRSMVARVVKRQESDWLSVWRLFGEPSMGEMKELSAAINDLRAAVKESPDNTEAVRAKIVEEFGPMLQYALGQLEP